LKNRMVAWEEECARVKSTAAAGKKRGGGPAVPYFTPARRGEQFGAITTVFPRPRGEKKKEEEERKKGERSGNTSCRPKMLPKKKKKMAGVIIGKKKSDRPAKKGTKGAKQLRRSQAKH